jgi:CheY-like chemotaxis protein
VDDLLHLAALEAGGLELEREAVDLCELVRGLVEATEPAARNRGLALSAELSREKLWVEADSERVRQILRNLLDNAIKFTERGKVRVHLRSAPRERGIYQVEIEVADTGIGMRLEDARRVLAPFEQADASSRRRHGGVGLGLAIAHRLATHMGGSLEIKTALGVGTRVSLRLPLASAEEPERRHGKRRMRRRAAPDAAPPRGERHALIVDDSGPARELLRAMLELSGWHASEAESGAAARSLLSKQAFDLILLDYQMPGADGAETAVALRRLSHTHHPDTEVHVYLLTANLFAHEQLGRLTAVDGVLAKPLSRAALLSLLDDIESGAQRRRLGEATPSGSDAGEACRPTPGELDPQVIGDLKALTGRDGASVFAKVAARTRQEQSEQLEVLETAIAQQDWENAARAAHAIAGQAAIVGARAVADLARHLEAELEGAPPSAAEARAQLEALRAAWREAEGALQREELAP